MNKTECKNVCSLDKETNSCYGCHRTLDELRQWRDLSIEARELILSEEIENV